jgi:hypothetical protein
MKNRYNKRSHISELKFMKLLKSFCLDLNASQISELVTINRNTVNKYLTEIRVRIGKLPPPEVVALRKRPSKRG